MKLPLILGARPQFSAKGPTVMVPEGSWEVVTENMRNSSLRLELVFSSDLQQSIDIVADCISSFVGPCQAQLLFVVRGDEDYVSVFARKK